jgi:Spy/CpxP family protein refolding chaperone
MTKFTWLVLAAVVAAVALPLAAGQRGGAGGGQRGKAAAAAKSSQEIVEAEVAQMVTECKLTAEQQEMIKEKAKAKIEALEAWEKANAEKLKAAEEASKAARTGADAAAKKKAGGDLKALQTAREAATAQADAAMLAVLTPEQKAAWDGFKLFETLSGRLRKATPTEEQNVKIKALCAAAAKEIGATQGDDKKSKKANSAVEGKLRWAIEQAVLTPEQRETITRKPAAGKGGTATPAAQPAAQPAAESK